MKHIPTVTLAISAYNEADTINSFLTSVLEQEQDGFVLEHIWIYDDGSTDDTVEKIHTIQSPIIEVIQDNKRIGKSSRLNQIYTRLESDFLVQSDADVVFAHPNVIRDMIAPLLKRKEVYMCGGHPQPIPAQTFTERAINCTCEAYMKLRSQVRDGNNILSVDGRILAYKKSLVKQITVPADMIANDAYTFYCCLTLGYKYVYVKTARVWFRSPATIRDQVRQNTRFLSTPSRMRQHFSPTLVDRETHIPLLLRIRNTLEQFILHPILCSYIFVVNRYCKLRSLWIGHKLTAKWPMAISTKSFKSVL